MKRTIVVVGALLAMTSGMREALADHSFAVHFVADEIVTVSGVVTTATRATASSARGPKIGL